MSWPRILDARLRRPRSGAPRPRPLEHSARFLTPCASSQEVERHCRAGRPSSTSFSFSGPLRGWSPSGATRLAGLGLGLATASWRGAPVKPGAGGSSGDSANDSSQSAGSSPAGSRPLEAVLPQPVVPHFGPCTPPLRAACGPGAGRGVQPMGGGGAENAPGPARCRCSSLAGHAWEGRGAGDKASGRAGEVQGPCRQRVCFVRPPARCIG